MRSDPFTGEGSKFVVSQRVRVDVRVELCVGRSLFGAHADRLLIPYIRPMVLRSSCLSYLQEDHKLAAASPS